MVENKFVPDQETQRLLEAAGPQGREKTLDVEHARSQLDAQYKNTLNGLRKKHTEWGKREGLLNRLKSPEGAHKEWIKKEAAARAKAKFNQMGNLAKSREERLQTFSRMTAEKLINFKTQIEVGQEVLSAVEAEKETYKELQLDFQEAAKALRAHHWKNHRTQAKGLKILSVLPGVKDATEWLPVLKDPFGATEHERMKSAASSAIEEAEKKMAPYEQKDQEQFSDLREAGNRLRSMLLTYDPSLLENLDELFIEHIQSTKENTPLKQKIEDIFGNDPAKKAEKDFFLGLLKELRSKEGKRAELFSTILVPRIAASGKEKNVTEQLLKLRLGSPIRITHPKNGEYKGHVWSTATASGKVVLKLKPPQGKKLFLLTLDTRSKKAIYIKDKAKTKPEEKYGSDKLEDLKFETQFNTLTP